MSLLVLRKYNPNLCLAMQPNGKKEAMKAAYVGHGTMQAFKQDNDNSTIMNGDPRWINCGSWACPDSYPICCTFYPGNCCPSSHPRCLPNNLCGGAMSTLTYALYS